MNVGARFLLSSFALACGSGEGPIAETNIPPDWRLLTSLDWQLDSGREDSKCTRTTVSRDLTIAEFAPVSPSGTHHMVLSTSQPSAPDGQFGCDVLEPRTLLFGAGIGSYSSKLPDGVVMRVRAGQQLVLDLHIFNTTLAPIRGTNGVRALIAEPAPGHVEAEVISVGTQDFRLPAGQQTVTKGGCTFQHESTVFALHPHMHALGTRMKIVVRTGGRERVIHDDRFDFGAQPSYPIEPLKLLPGDRIEIECTHRNTGNSEVTYGASSTAEMCAAGVYRYPAVRDGAFFCSD